MKTNHCLLLSSRCNKNTANGTMYKRNYVLCLNNWIVVTKCDQVCTKVVAINYLMTEVEINRKENCYVGFVIDCQEIMFMYSHMLKCLRNNAIKIIFN